jgi:glutathione S-transferase
MKIKLHQYPSIWGLSSLSPFCIKVEAFLKYNCLTYEVVTEESPSKGPKGKMPFIKDGEQIIPDSSDIISHLILKHSLQKQINSSPEALAFKSMLEESFYFILLYSRWVDMDGFNIVKRDFGNLFLPGYGQYFMGVIRKSLVKQAHMQGIGRHSKEEVYSRGIAQLQAFETRLGNNKFFFGNEIFEIDFSLFGFLITIEKSPIDTILYKEFRKMNNLTKYLERLDKLFNQGSEK